MFHGLQKDGDNSVHIMRGSRITHVFYPQTSGDGGTDFVFIQPNAFNLG